MKLHLIAGARPNFMKIAPIINAIHEAKEKGHDISYRLVHTGQHYDEKMSNAFFKELNIPSPDVNLGCGGGTQAEQTAAIMIAYEKYLLLNPADLVIVVGDVTSTMACAIVAKKMITRVAHVEGGLRSFDLTMPEEINRMVTDCLADYFFTTSETANDNLRKAGVPEKRIYFVGNVMIDTLLANQTRFRKPEIWEEFGLQEGNYLVITLHRPNNVDNDLQLKALLEAIIESSQNIPIIFPVHPRTAKKINDLISHHSLLTAYNLHLLQPLGYLEFNYLVQHAKAVITDSGGITEETTVMGVPCITLRDNTERPETVSLGTNELISTNPDCIKPALTKLFNSEWKRGVIPPMWDGKAAQRIVDIISKIVY
ncbi:MAG: UDP-N-acetylglucosamine 2-epimerase (non-hydrolyzing) [Bacteroidales bacterium]|nr:UDP-N-acetylglucosamine 2-epimerase (non-hydrolyzing) [Bacteroidales bacterium]